MIMYDVEPFKKPIKFTFDGAITPVPQQEDLAQFRQDRAASAWGDIVRAYLEVKNDS